MQFAMDNWQRGLRVELLYDVEEMCGRFRVQGAGYRVQGTRYKEESSNKGQGKQGAREIMNNYYR
jgi:hypothetical protein